MPQKTALQEFLEQIVLKQVQGSVYLLPAITDIQIAEALEKEKKQIIDSYYAGTAQFDNSAPIVNPKTPEDYYNELSGL
mgnify:FL=1